MESANESHTMTPRRSSRRIQSLREKTPEPSSPKPRGPRSMSKFKKATKKQEIPSVIVTRPSLPAKEEEEKITDDNKSSQSVLIEETSKKEEVPTENSNSKQKSHKKLNNTSYNSCSSEGQLSKTSSLEYSSAVGDDTTVIEVNSSEIVKSQEQTTGTDFADIAKSPLVNETTEAAFDKIAETPLVDVKVEKEFAEITKSLEAQDTTETQTLLTKTDLSIQNKKNETKELEMVIKREIEEPKSNPIPEVAKVDANVTPQLMDESIISIEESPEVVHRPKDSTFSPIVDDSIHDSRPNIDLATTTPKSVALRTSTPYVKKIQKFNVDAVVIPSKTMTPNRVVEDKKEKNNQTLNKSILKSRRKRSMSVADADSFMHRRVMFNSPKIMDIDTIDEKMMASFIEEKENSIMKKPPTSARRQRSLSTGTPSKKPLPQLRSKMPNFKAIHEIQFKKMESIADHAERKAKRAKQLGTPNRQEQAISQPSQEVVKREPKEKQLSKIPTRFAFGVTSRTLKRSMSSNVDEPPSKRTFTAEPTNNSKKVAVVSAVPRIDSAAVTAVKFSAQSSSQPATSAAQKNRSKVEERREKNMSLFKSKASRTDPSTRNRTDRRAQSVDVLRGVRLNRRFELQMKHRRDADKPF